MDLNITLLKSSVTSFDQVLRPNKVGGDLGFSDRTADTDGNAGLGFEHRIYIQAKRESVPKWLQNYQGLLTDPEEIRNTVFSGLFLFKVTHNGADRFFAISQGYGHHGINPDQIERDFGLKTTLSIVDSGRLKHIDTREMVVSSKQKMVTTNAASSIYALEEKADEDLLRKVMGYPKTQYAFMGSYLGGYDNLSIKGWDHTVDEIGSLALSLLERYESNDYRQDFEFIDRIAPVKDPVIIQELKTRIAMSLEARLQDESILIAFPNQYDWDGCTSYRVRFSGRRGGADVGELSLASLYPLLPEEASGTELLDGLEVTGWEDAQPKTTATKLYRLLHYRTFVDGREYFLSDGQWYAVSEDYLEQLRHKAGEIEDLGDGYLPAMTEGESEEGYNLRAAHEKGFRCFDRKLFYFPGSRGKVEYCDLYAPGSPNLLVCVKKYKKSHAMSHLFAQARVAGDLLLKEDACRDRFIQDSSVALETWKAADNKFVFAIAKDGTGSLVSSLPVFSLLDLVRTADNLRAQGYKVAITRIGMPTNA